MAISKRPPLQTRSDSPRSDTRNSVVLTGTCQFGDRASEEVLLTDVSSKGCQVRGNSIGVTKGEPVQLWFGQMGPIAATLKWLKKGSIGLAFDAPLGESLLKQLQEAPRAPSNVVALRRRSDA